jgi:NAD(P)-dependent dehydrogenase (short-subunit alcohol dehydrogenase family)
MIPFSIEKIPSQKGKTAIVTGANAGIGFETTLVLAGKGMKVIMACKSLQRAEKAKQKIAVKVPDADLEIMIIDMGSFASIRNFADRFLSEYDKLDLLINNAGIMIPRYTRTEDGFESQLAVNYLGHFLLTGLLFNVITQTPGSRIVSLASLAHKKGTINFDDLNSEKKYFPMGAYRQSKLACLIFSYELQRRLDNAGLKTLSVAAHPGLSLTYIVKRIPSWLFYAAKPLAALLIQSPARGALPILFAALCEDVNGGDYCGPTGRSERSGEPGKVSSMPQSHDRETAKKLWELSEILTGVKYP